MFIRPQTGREGERHGPNVREMRKRLFPPPKNRAATSKDSIRDGIEDSFRNMVSYCRVAVATFEFRLAYAMAVERVVAVHPSKRDRD